MSIPMSMGIYELGPEEKKLLDQSHGSSNWALLSALKCEERACSPYTPPEWRFDEANNAEYYFAVAAYLETIGR